MVVRRRGQVTVQAIVFLVIGLLLGAAIGYFAAPKGDPAVLEELQEKDNLINQLQQDLNELKDQLEALKEGSTITVTVWAIGPDPPSEYRFENFKLAAEILNMMLEDLGANVTIEIEGQFFARPVEWEQYRQNFYQAYEAGNAPDIYLTGHEDIGYLAANGFIIPLDDYIEAYWDLIYYDFFPALWESVKYDGKMWAVPQDTEARPLYFRKDVLRELGWSEEEINALPEKIKNGEFTLWDLLEVAKQAVDAGLVERGLVHRVKEGYDYLQFYLSFGGSLYNPDTGKMVFNTTAWGLTLDWFYKAVYEYGVIHPNQFSGDWDADFHGPFTEGRALFLSGGTWHKGEWINKGLLSEEEFIEVVGYALHPASKEGGRPVTLSHPLVYTITSQAKDRGLDKIAFLLITLVSLPTFNSIHAVQSAHLAIARSQISETKYSEDWFLADVAYMLEYTTFIPNHPDWGKYSRIVFNALRAVETGDMTPQEALDYMVTELQNQIPDSVEFVE